MTNPRPWILPPASRCRAGMSGTNNSGIRRPSWHQARKSRQALREALKATPTGGGGGARRPPRRVGDNFGMARDYPLASVHLAALRRLEPVARGRAGGVGEGGRHEVRRWAVSTTVSTPRHELCRFGPEGTELRSVWCFVGVTASQASLSMNGECVSAGQIPDSWSGRRDSNPRPPPWQCSTSHPNDQRKLRKTRADAPLQFAEDPAVSCCFSVSCGRSAA